MSKSPKPEDVAAEISKDGDQGQETSSEKWAGDIDIFLMIEDFNVLLHISYNGSSQSICLHYEYFILFYGNVTYKYPQIQVTACRNSIIGNVSLRFLHSFAGK